MKKYLFSLFFAVISVLGFAQTTVSFTQQKSYYVGTFADGGGFNDNGTTEVLLWANTPSTQKQAVAWRLFQTNGTSQTGNNRALQVGDQFTIQTYASAAFGSMGFSLNKTTTYANWGDRNANSRLTIEADGTGGSWYMSGNSTSSFSYNVGSTYHDYKFVIYITSSNTADVDFYVDGNWQNRLYNQFLSGTSAAVNIRGYSVFLNDDYNGSTNANTYWKQTTEVKNNGYVQLGYYLTGGNTYTPGTISDGFDAGSATTVSSNSVRIGGDSSTKVIFSYANTYTGTTTINSAATLKLNASGVIPDISNMILSGGTFMSGSVGSSGMGYDETIGTLQLTDDSTITLAGGNAHAIRFADSNATSWTLGKKLMITGWSGTAGTSGTKGQIFIGTDSSGLTSTQLSRITFSGVSCSTGAMLLPTGELVPAPTIPTINTQPTNQTICSSGTASISVSATGTGLTYQWRLNGANITGATSSTLSLSGLTSANNVSAANGYDCVVSSSCGTSTTTSRVALTVNDAPSITVQPSTTAQTVCQGSSATLLSVTATGSNLLYQWYSNSSNSNSGGIAIAGATSSTYAPDTTSAGTLYYYVKISNVSCTTITSSVSGAVKVNATGTWLGTTSSDWGTASNWCGGAVPTSSTDVVIPSGTTYSPTLIAGAVAKSVNINLGAILNGSSSGTLDLYGDFTNNGGTGFGFISSGSAAEILTFNSASTVSGFSGTTFQNVVVKAGVTLGAILRVGGGNLTIYSGGYFVTGSPIYLAGSNLVYSTGGTYHRGLEWTSASSGAGWPRSVKVTGNTTLDYNNSSAGLNGNIANNLTVDVGSALYMDYGLTGSASLTVAGNVNINGKFSLGKNSGGDLYVGGNYNVGVGNTLNGDGFPSNNGRAVYFNGTSVQTITKTGGGKINFNCLIVNNTSGIKLGASTTGWINNNTSNGTVNQLQLLGGDLDLNGQSFYMNCDAATTGSSSASASGSTNISFSGTRKITSSVAGGNFYFSGAYDGGGYSNVVFNPISSGTLTFDTGITLQTEVGVDLGNVNVNSNLQINQFGFVINTLTGNSPKYGPASTLIYNNGSNGYDRSYEWTSATTGANGYPNNILIQNGTVLHLNTNAVANDIGCAGNLTISLGTMDMGNMTHKIIVGSYLSNSGIVNMSSAAGGDITVGDYLTNSITGTFNVYARTLSVANALTNNGSLTVESGGNLLQTNDNAANTGSISVMRNFVYNTARNQYNLVISPTVGFNIKYMYPQITAPTSSNPYAGYYNESNDFFYLSSGAYIAGRALEIKEPATTYVSALNSDAKFTGIPFNGTLTYSLAFTSAEHGYNLIGNPYPSNLDVKKLYDANNGAIDSTFRFWDNTTNSQIGQLGPGYTGNSYAIYNAVENTSIPASYVVSGNKISSSKIPTNVVGVAQGFIVQALGSGKSVNFNNSMRTGNTYGAAFFGKGISTTYDRYWLNLTTPSNLVNTLAVVYFSGGNNGFTQDDSKLVALTSDAVYSLAGTEKVLINGRNSFDSSDVVNLGSNHYTNGAYTFSLENKEGVFATGQDIYLKDLVAGTVTNLSKGNYTFNASAGEIAGRFQIVYQSDSTLGVSNTTSADLQVYRSGESFVIASSGQKITGIEVYDFSGRMVKSLKANDNKVTVDAKFMVEGSYMVKVNRNGNVTTRKVLK